MRGKEGLRKEIERVLNVHNAEAGCDTPDFILAEYLMDCLKAFDKYVKRREKWYGRQQEGKAIIDDNPLLNDR